MSNTAGVPHLNSFAEAKRWYENTKPIRGHAEKVRPLGFRRHHRMASIAMPDADTVVFSYYGKPFVTWHSDNTFTVTNGVYQSAYTAKHLSYFLPRQWYTDWVNCSMVLRNFNNRYHIPHNAAYKFAPVGDNFDLVDKPVAYAIRKKRNSLKHELAKYEPFLDWLSVVTSVSNEVEAVESGKALDVLREAAGLRSQEWYTQRRAKYLSSGVSFDPDDKSMNDWYASESLPMTFNATYSKQHRFHTPTCAVLLNWVSGTDAEKWVHAMQIISAKAGTYKWRKGEGYIWRLSVDQAKEYLNALALHVYRDTAFYFEPLPTGELAPRTNTRYFQVYEISST